MRYHFTSIGITKLILLLKAFESAGSEVVPMAQGSPSCGVRSWKVLASISELRILVFSRVCIGTSTLSLQRRYFQRNLQTFLRVQVAAKVIASGLMIDLRGSR